MGNCVPKPESSTAEISPCDFINNSTTVHLYGSSTSIAPAYVRFALLLKGVTVQFIKTETPRCGSENPVLEVDSDIVSGSRETLIQFIEARFPQPSLIERFEDSTTPLVTKAVRLQHRSMLWHLERMVRWGQDLETRGGRKIVDPTVGSARMEVKKFGNSYSQLLEMMLEHAQMEERVVFTVLDKADRGICKVANKEHARDLPIMNGIKEDIKSIGVLDHSSPARQEALSNLSIRLKSLQRHCVEHFEEEEKDVLPLMEAVELSKEQEMRVLEQCFDVMQGTHSYLFKFLVEGLLPREAMQYLDLIIISRTEERALAMLTMVVE